MTLDREWSLLTPVEKREERLKKWLSAPGVEFVNGEAKEHYAIRANRIVKAINLEEADRVPCQIPAGSFPAYYAGYDLKRVMYDLDAMRTAWMKLPGT